MNYSNNQIFDKVSEIMQELFELPADKIQLKSKLNEDLSLDSIDAIDLITHLQIFVGQRIKPEDFKTLRTVEDIVNASENILKNKNKNEC